MQAGESAANEQRAAYRRWEAAQSCGGCGHAAPWARAGVHLARPITGAGIPLAALAPMRGSTIAATGILLLAACSNETAQGDATPEVSPTEEPTVAADPTVTAAPTATVTPTPEPTPEPTPTPTPFGAGVFDDPDSCTNEEAGYRIAFPDAWWVNTAYDDPDLGPTAACVYFAPTAFDVTTATEDDPIPDGVAITISHTPGCLGYIHPHKSLTEMTISGFDARAEELAEGKRESNPPLLYRYVVDRLPDASCEGGANGDMLLFTTAPGMAGNYEENKAMLDRMVQTAEISAP